MKKKILKVIALTAAIVACCTAVLFTGCDDDSSSSSSTSTETSKHVVDPNGLNGDLLDDGGAINYGEVVEVVSGVEVSGEHQIVIGTDIDCYDLYGGLSDTQIWATSGYAHRIQCTSVSQYVVFTLDFSGLTDRSKVGCMVTLIQYRAQTLISISADGENWTDIGYPDEDCQGIKADYSEGVSTLHDGQVVSDTGLWQYYYSLSNYIDESNNGILYLKCGYTLTDSTTGYWSGMRDSGVGADVIDYISYYDNLELVYEVID